MASSLYENNDSFLRHCVHPNEKHILDFIRLLGECNKGTTEKVDIATKSINLLKCMMYIWN